MKPIPLKTSSLFFGVCLFLAASVPRLFSLGAHWTSDEVVWLDRSTAFMAAVEMGIFSECREAVTDYLKDHQIQGVVLKQADLHGVYFQKPSRRKKETTDN